VLKNWKQYLTWFAIALAGALAAESPSLVKDLVFLHQARVISEMQRQQQQQQTPPPPTPTASNNADPKK
jgi:hypothetical protein